MPAHANLALVLGAAGLAALGRALACEPAHGLLWFNRGNLLGEARSYRRGLALDPGLGGAWLNLGALALAAAAYGRALAAFGRALALAAALAAPALRNLGLVHLELGQTGRALAGFRRSLAADPRYWPAHADLIGALRLAEGVGVTAELAQCRRFAVAHAAVRARDPGHAPAHDPGHALAHDPERRLRIGYVGADAFRRHTAAVSLLPLIEAHDLSQVEVVCYSDVPAGGGDVVSGRFAALARVVGTHGLSDAALASRIAADGIDIAVDVIGHARGTRLLALAQKPAPVQASLLLMGSSGLPAMDYAIGDDELTPPGAERGFSEALLRIERAFVYRPLVALPPIAARAEAGPVVFGSFNQLAKLQPGCIAAWAGILGRLPGARLILRARALGDGASAARVAAAFAAHGIAPERLGLRGWAAASHLEAYGEIDIALDPFPYGGVITTLEALSMGVPVISLTGERVLGRYGGVFLNSLGLGDLAVGDAAAYVEAAVGLAHDHERRTRLRSSLRSRLAASRLADGQAFARALEGAYRLMWRRWCEAQAAPTTAP
jgi:protein O-GlcNAc transferase